jgi:elongation factor Ts
MAISAAMVKQLREATSAGMMDCKKALDATSGDMDKAIEWLRENGLMKAAKRNEKIAAEGVSFAKASADEKDAIIIEVNSETDFVAKNDKFTGFVEAVADQALTSSSTTVDELLAEKWAKNPSETVQSELTNQIATIGENMNIRRFAKLSQADGFVQTYIHGSGRIAVILSVKTTVVNDAVKEAVKNIAMQIAAMNPEYLNESEISQEYRDHEMEILKAQVANDPEMAKKPANIVEKMLTGRLNKQLKEICLVDQAYVKDSSMTVQKYVESVAKENNAEISLVKFVRYETGEGIEKKQEDFAAEVAAQING